MRVATKAINDHLVPKFEVVIERWCAFLEKAFRDFVNDPGLAVHVRQVHEDALVGRQRKISICRHGFLGQRKGQSVVGIGERAAAVHVPGQERWREIPQSFSRY